MKRILDVIVSFTGLLFLLPLLMVVAVAIRWRMGAPVLFRQVRPGFCGRPFSVFKFRTMNDACDASGALLPDRERLTPLGKWLRNLSFDELPQLLNVLQGDLSLVGPRPLLMEYLPFYTPEQARRHNVKPGITGWAQVNGRNTVSWEDRLGMDVWYVDHRSFWLDLKIMIATIGQVVRRRGIHADGHPTMTKFVGTATQVQK